MSDLRVWVDGQERVIRGVSEDTTCESVLIVLAKAAGKFGRVALLEKWRDLERILPRNEKPVKCLRMWGELSQEVKFILQDDTGPRKSSTYLGKCSTVDLVIDNKGFDPKKRSFDCESLEAITANQAKKTARLARASEIFDIQLDCWTDDDEASLYYTEDEITEDLATKLSQVLKLQAKELSYFETTKQELDKLKKNQEKLISDIESFRENINAMEDRISDLQAVGGNMLSQHQNRDCNTDIKEGFEERTERVNSDVNRELRVLRLKLNKQNTMSERQALELENISRSVCEISKSIQQRTTKLASLESELYSGDVYYDLDEHFRTPSPEMDGNDSSLIFEGAVDSAEGSRTSTLPYGNELSHLETDLDQTLNSVDFDSTRNIKTKNTSQLNGVKEGKYIHSSSSRMQSDSSPSLNIVDVNSRPQTSTPKLSLLPGMKKNKHLLPPTEKYKGQHRKNIFAIIQNDLCDQGVFV